MALRVPQYSADFNEHKYNFGVKSQDSRQAGASDAIQSPPTIGKGQEL